jgi:hypothetical protein
LKHNSWEKRKDINYIIDNLDNMDYLMAETMRKTHNFERRKELRFAKHNKRTISYLHDIWLRAKKREEDRRILLNSYINEIVEK